MSDNPWHSGLFAAVSSVATISAYVSEPTLTGLQGVFGAAMIGSGTLIISGVYGTGGAIVGGIAGAAFGTLRRTSLRDASIGAMFLGMGSAVVGAFPGYDVARDVVMNGVNHVEATEENQASNTKSKGEFSISGTTVFIPTLNR